MVTALSIVVIPGMVFNNLQNNGLIQPPTNGVYAMTCTSANGGTCVLAASIGCTVSSNYCNLSGSSIAFLNQCSPFTNILELNYVGFVASFFTTCGQTVSQTTTANSILSGSPSANETFSNCSPTYGTFGGIQPEQWSCTVIFPVVQGLTQPIYLTCLSWNGVIGNSYSGGGYPVQVPTASLCNAVDSSSPQNGWTASCWLYGVPTGSSKAVTSAICNNFSQFVQQTSSFASGLNLGNILSFFLSILGGTLVLLLALGVNVGAATVQAGTNPQGTKFAQSFGIATLLWFPLYSEFQTWFSSGYLPYGLDGIIGVVSIALIATYFVGAFMVSQTGTAASQ